MAEARTATRSTVVPQAYGTAEVARILGLRVERVRAIARAGVCHPARRGRALEFSFQDLVLLRTAQGLLRKNVPTRRVRRALNELARQLPPDRPLSGIRIYADGRHVVARDGRAAWRPESGQIVFTFAVDELARRARTVVSVRERHDPQVAAKPASPEDAWGWFEHAMYLEHENDREGARAAYQSALELDPTLADAYINLGRLAHEDGNPREGVRLYQLALQHEPTDPVAHYDLALAYEDVQEIPAAIHHYRRALSVDPCFADAHFNLGRLLDRTGKRNEALRHLVRYKLLTREK